MPFPFQAILVVDMQNGFVDHMPDKGLPARIKSLIEAFGTEDVYWTQFHNHSGSIYQKVFDWGRFLNAEDVAVVPELAPLAQNTFKKYGYLLPESAMKALSRYDSVGLVGVNTDICILSAAYSLWDGGIRPVILADYCASVKGAVHHQNALNVVQRPFGAHSLLYGDYTKWSR